MMKVFLYTVFSLLLLNQTVLGHEKSAAEEFIKSNLDAVFAILQKEDLSPQARKNEVAEIVTPMFDFKLMAKLSLGKKYWPGLSPDERERFTELFIESLRDSYLNILTAYTDEKVIYESTVAVKKKVHLHNLMVKKST